MMQRASSREIPALIEGAGQVQGEHARYGHKVRVVERERCRTSRWFDTRVVEDCPAFEAGTEATGVDDAVVAVLIGPGGYRLREGPLVPAHAAQVDVGQSELVKCRAQGRSKRLSVSSRRTSNHRPDRRRNVAVPRDRRKPAETAPAMSAGSPVSASSSRDGRNVASVSAKHAARWRAAYSTRNRRRGSSKRPEPALSRGGHWSGSGSRPSL